MKNLLLVLLATAILGFFLGTAFFNLSSSSFSQNELPLEKVLQEQHIGPVWENPIKYVIRGAINSGTSAQTIALLLLLTVVVAFIAGIRHLIGLKSFGIFLPAALSVVFVSTGPLTGIGIFLLIIIVASLVRFVLRKTKIRLQYLPRMAFILWVVIIFVLLTLYFTNISVLPLLILVLLAEDFIRVQLGKSVRAAIDLTIETLILALASFLILTFTPFQQFALLNPEILLISVAVFDFVLGKYIGLRFLEYYRFRKLIRS